MYETLFKSIRALNSSIPSTAAAVNERAVKSIVASFFPEFQRTKCGCTWDESGPIDSKGKWWLAYLGLAAPTMEMSVSLGASKLSGSRRKMTRLCSSGPGSRRYSNVFSEPYNYNQREWQRKSNEKGDKQL